ncbi:Rid family detoxifying hydrolase [Natrinema longum]|uniref:RidA family protein n=1 Tax=Natrinema longum TaxID=370324 RepID=A0A8A2U6R3_9EURY|nr:Rid family detoxifying hydrolase [Natrinema longum]MBZ6495078.1 Rid family detoxifying hydrolase [Natrinema longum]QSW83628.1 RidA family protein [Natrinema longum]
MNEIETEDAPASIGPFSQAVRDGDRVYVSGQGPVDPESGAIVGDDITEQTHATMENIETVLEAGSSSLENIVKSTVFVTDMDDYEEINAVYEQYVTEPYPARSAIEVSRLPIEIGVEIDVIARVDP